MSDEKSAEKPADVDLAVSVDQAKTASKRAARAPRSAVEQVKADVSARADVMPVTPAAPDSDRLPAVGSGIHDALGVEVPTQEQFVQAGGNAENYDRYVAARCAPIAPPAPVAASEPTKMAGKMLAEQILADARRKRTGQSIEAPLREEDLKEDWQEAQAAQRRAPADPALAGLYIVKHGELYFHGQKSVPTGKKVMLSAEDARTFLELELVRPLVTAA